MRDISDPKDQRNKVHGANSVLEHDRVWPAGTDKVGASREQSAGERTQAQSRPFAGTSEECSGRNVDGLRMRNEQEGGLQSPLRLLQERGLLSLISAASSASQRRAADIHDEVPDSQVVAKE